MQLCPSHARAHLLLHYPALAELTGIGGWCWRRYWSITLVYVKFTVVNFVWWKRMVKITWFGFFKCFKPLNQIHGIVYVKTEFRFVILEVKNIMNRTFTHDPTTFSYEVMTKSNIGWRPYWILRLWRPQWAPALARSKNEFSMFWSTSVSNFMLVDKCAQYHPNCSLSSSTSAKKHGSRKTTTQGERLTMATYNLRILLKDEHLQDLEE